MQALGSRHLPLRNNVLHPNLRNQCSKRSTRVCRATGDAVKPDTLMQVALEAGRAGAKVIEESAKLPRQIERKEGGTGI
eukprot:1157900-Pelagomonas_calceolata.AAC.3